MCVQIEDRKFDQYKILKLQNWRQWDFAIREIDEPGAGYPGCCGRSVEFTI